MWRLHVWYGIGSQQLLNGHCMLMPITPIVSKVIAEAEAQGLDTSETCFPEFLESRWVSRFEVFADAL